jgi:hypothetical protein
MEQASLLPALSAFALRDRGSRLLYDDAYRDVSIIELLPS